MTSKPKEQMEVVTYKGADGADVPCYVHPEEPEKVFTSPLPLIQEEADGMEHDEQTELLKAIVKALAERERTAIPNWVIPIFAGILIALLTFVYTTLQNAQNKQWDASETHRLQIEKINNDLTKIQTERQIEKDSRKK